MQSTSITHLIAQSVSNLGHGPHMQKFLSLFIYQKTCLTYEYGKDKDAHHPAARHEDNLLEVGGTVVFAYKKENIIDLSNCVSQFYNI